MVLFPGCEPPLRVCASLVQLQLCISGAVPNELCIPGAVSTGFGLVLVWFWSGSGLVLVWFWSGSGLVLVWFWQPLSLGGCAHLTPRSVQRTCLWASGAIEMRCMQFVLGEWLGLT